MPNVPGYIDIYENPDNGTNKVRLIGPSALSSNYTLTLPTALGTNGQVLSTNAAGVLSWDSKVGLSGDESIAGHKTFMEIQQHLHLQMLQIH